MKNQTIYKLFSILLIVTVLSTTLIVPHKASASAASGIAGKCVTNILNQKVTAYAAGYVIAAISEAIQAVNRILAVPTGSEGSASGSTLQSGEGASTNIEQFLKPMADCIVHEAAQLAVDRLGEKTVGWIRYGLNGSPNYATDLNGLFLNLSKTTAGDFKNQIRGTDICDFSGTGGGASSAGTSGYVAPTGDFKTDLANSVGLSTRENSRAKYAARVKCPFPGTSAKDFYADFNNGGLNAFEASLSDSGNPFGVTIQTGQELALRNEETQRVQQQQLTQSNGFFGTVDTSKCNFPDGYKTYLDSLGDATALTNAQRLYCKTTTPGKTVSDLLSQVVGSDLSRLMASNSVNTIMEGFITQQVNDAVSGIFR